MNSQERHRLENWIDEHGNAVFGYLFSLTKRRDVAEDLAQEVFCRAWQARDRYLEQGKPRAFLLRIAERMAQDYFRRLPRAAFESSSDFAEHQAAGDAVDQALEQAEMYEQLNVAFERLSEHQRKTLLLRYYGEMSFRDIALTLQLPLNSVLSHCRRGLLALREMLVGEKQ